MASTSRSDNLDHLVRELRTGGPTPAGVLRDRLSVSPATLSRLLGSLRSEVLTVGATRSRRYALRRTVPGLPQEIPVYDVGPRATRVFAHLHPVEPRGFYVESEFPVGGFHPDLPWFLYDLRPAGFLGRLVPRLHPELGLPEDILAWSGDHVLRWLHEWGLDTVGSFVVGEPAFVRLPRHETSVVPAGEREARYPKLADDAMSLGMPGSSAAGEQPKFLAVRKDSAGETPVLVKFSPRTADAAARRTADLLRCEHHALQILASSGVAAARSAIVEADGRVFLEVERFDRSERGRLGLVSLMALAMHEGADIGGWTSAADDLARAEAIRAEDRVRIYWLDRFGQWIGNTDRHAGNLSFFFAEGRAGALAPTYDMLPMRYAVRGGEFETLALAPPSPTPRLAATWRESWRAATDFWNVVAEDKALGEPLRRVAGTNVALLAERRPELDRLPA